MLRDVNPFVIRAVIEDNFSITFYANFKLNLTF